MIKPIAFVVLIVAVAYGAKNWLADEYRVNNNDLLVDSSLNITASNKEKTVSQDIIKNWVYSQAALTPEARQFLATLPASLKDSPLPSLLDVDIQGDLIVNVKVKNLFEFYLTAMGEDSLEDCISRIRYNLKEQLAPAALAQATEILEGYIQYRNHIGEIKNNFMARYSQGDYDIGVVQEMKESAKESRSLFLSGEAINAFYEKEDEYDNLMMQRIAIQSDSSLSPADKMFQLKELDSQSPKWLLEQEKQAKLISIVQSQEKTLRNNGGSEQDIQSLRIESYGEQGANNLQILDNQRAQWHKRVDEYRHDAVSVLGSSEYSEGEQKQLLTDLRQQYFSGPELIRIQSLDKIYLRKIQSKG